MLGRRTRRAANLHTYSCDKYALFHVAAQGDFGVGAGASATMTGPARSGAAMNGTDTFPIAMMIIFGVPNLLWHVARTGVVCDAARSRGRCAGTTAFDETGTLT